MPPSSCATPTATATLQRCCLKAPEQAAVQALYAFAADVATIRDRAREPAAGEIRPAMVE